MLESKIQSSIRDELKKHGWTVIKLIQTSMPGIPDQLAIKEGQKVAWIEVKQPGNKPTPLQLLRHELLRKLGFTVIVATSKDEIKHLCN